MESRCGGIMGLGGRVLVDRVRKAYGYHHIDAKAQLAGVPAIYRLAVPVSEVTRHRLVMQREVVTQPVQ